MTISNLTPYTGGKPTIGQDQPTFNQNMSDELDYLNTTLPNELNTVIGETNTATAQVTSDKNAAEAAKSAAQTAQSLAESAAAAAAASGNFVGEFIPGTTSATLGESYSYDGEVWLCLVSTTTTPATTNSNWKKTFSDLDAIARANNVSVEKVGYLAVGEDVTGKEYLFVDEKTYFVSGGATGVISDIGTDINGDRTIISNIDSYLATDITKIRQDDIRLFGAVGITYNSTDDLQDASAAIQNALDKNGSFYVPSGLKFSYSSPFTMTEQVGVIEGRLYQLHDGIGFNLTYGNLLRGGRGIAHLVRASSNTFSSDLACMVLIHRNSSFGAIENKIDNLKIVTEDFLADPDGVQDPANMKGKGIWLLAGGNYGLSDNAAYEFCYRNKIDARVDGFINPILLEADQNYVGGVENGRKCYVNGNHLEVEIRRGQKYVYLKCPLDSGTGSLLGECSGNTGRFDIQYSNGFFESALEIQGRNNKFDVQLWDCPESAYPAISYTKQDDSLAYGVSTPHGNLVTISGGNVASYTGGMYEQDVGFNDLINSRPEYGKDVFPVVPIGNGHRQGFSYIGAVDNFLGLGDNVQGITFSELDASDAVIGSLAVTDQDYMFKPERHLYSRINVNTTTYKVRVTVTLPTSINHFSLLGVSQAYKQGLIDGVVFTLYNSSGTALLTKTANAKTNSLFHTGLIDVTNVKSFTIEMTVPQDGTISGEINISNLFAFVYNRRNDMYHARRDADDSIDGDWTFNGEPVFNQPVTFGGAVQFFSSSVAFDTSKGPILKASNGSAWRIIVSSSGALSTVAI